MRRWAACAALALALGQALACAAPPPTHFAYVSSEPALDVVLIAQQVVGKSCASGGERVEVGPAVADALSKVKGASVLLDAKVGTDGDCILVVGDAAEPAKTKTGARAPTAPLCTAHLCLLLIDGYFAQLAADPVPLRYTVVSTSAAGEACRNEESGKPFAATKDALAKHAPADALVNATFRREGRCVYVAGTAVKVE